MEQDKSLYNHSRESTSLTFLLGEPRKSDPVDTPRAPGGHPPLGVAGKEVKLFGLRKALVFLF